MKRRWQNRSAVVALVAWVAIGASSLLAQRIPAAPANEYNDLKFADDLRKFTESSWLDAYRKVGHRDKAWDAAAQAFLEKFCHYAAYQEVWRGIRPSDVPTAESVRRLCNDLLNLKCDDPQILAAYGELLKDNNRMADAHKPLHTALVAMNDAQHPAYNILYVCNLLFQIDKVFKLSAAERDLMDSATVDAVVRCMCDVPPTRADRYIRFRLIHPATKDRPKVEAAIRENLSTAKNVDPWLRKIFTAENETHLGWAWMVGRAGQNGGAVDPESFATHLQHSSALLTEAWKIDPTLPGPASLLITVSMGQGQQADNLPRTWFDRAVEAKVDDRLAMEGMYWAMRPRWGGSLDQVVSLGREFVQSRRFDTQVPAWILESAYSLAADRNETLNETYALPEVYHAVNEMFQGYEHTLPAGPGRDWVFNQHAMIAVGAGHFADARTVLERIGPKLDRQVFQGMSTNVERAISQVYAYTGPNAAEARKATELALKDDPEALDRFTALVKAIKADDPEAYYYRSHVAELEFKTAFQGGDWVSIQPKESLYLWTPMQGKWTVDNDKLIGVCDGSGLMLRLIPETKADAYEIEATLTYTPAHPGANACGIYCDRTLQTWANGVFYSTGFKDVSWYANGKPGVTRHAIESSNLLHITMENGRLRATFNGQQVPIPIGTDPLKNFGAEARISIGGVYADAELTLTVTGLKVRKLIPGNN